MLKELQHTPYTVNEVTPQGWLKRQLEIQAEGLSGNLDKIWPDIRDSRWIGGEKEGWERVPYWLDGFIPLAYLVNNEDMKLRAKKYIDAILERQQPDGWICPCEKDERPRYDVWAAFLICKVLVVYHDCTQDERIEGAVYAALKNLHLHMEGNTLFGWALSRWFECLIPLFWLYERRPEKWMLDLAFALQEQGLDYKKLFKYWRFQEPAEHGRWSFMTHVVNIAMALKSEALMSRVTEEDESPFAKEALHLLQKDHGMATGHFTGDECLSGNSPTQGSELCSVVEAMYSYEHLLSLTNDTHWGDMLEKLAYNALPATTSPDMWTHQYDQMTNQVECSYLPEEHIIFRTNSNESHLFGLEPNFGCCTANFNQGWPKFALSVFMKTEQGIAITAIAPAILTTNIYGVAVSCEIETSYPFRDEYKVIVKTEKPVDFTLELRIPGFAAKAKVDGKEVVVGENYKTKKTWSDQTVCVSLDFETEVTNRPNDLVCINRGPLLYSIKIDEKRVKHEFVKNDVERKFPYCDYEIFAESNWNYGLNDEKFELHLGEIGDYPFAADMAPVWFTTSMCEVDWKMEYGVCKITPESNIPISEPKQVKLIPYGCTNLRLTEFPKL